MKELFLDNLATSCWPLASGQGCGGQRLI